MNRKTKIICTIGPATATVDRLTELFASGMDVARLNFSHGTREEHGRLIEALRAAAALAGRTVAILQDLQGPKIRTGAIRGGAAALADGDPFIITTAPLAEGDARKTGTTYAHLSRDVAAGSTLLIDDGAIILKVERVVGPDIHTRVVKGGMLHDHKGIIAPGTPLSAPALSDKDIGDVRFGIEHGVDAVALSFVRSEQDVLALRMIMAEAGRVVPIVAKIERAEAVDDLEDIIRHADAVMVARGDLGLEMAPEEVPVLQKRIIQRCNYYGTPVITATQMLESMIEHPRPTRAEASDVANAVVDGTDCVMLSGETSVGRYPAETVRTMDRIIRRTEEEFPAAARSHEIPEDESRNTADAIGRACCETAAQVGAAAIVALTSSGGTARLIAKHRPRTPIVALTNREDTERAMSLVWGVSARRIPSLEDAPFDTARLAALARDSGLVRAGEVAVFTAGLPLGSRTPTNLLFVARV